MYRFYRPDKTDTVEFLKIIEGMEADMKLLVSDSVPTEELKEFVADLIGQGKRLTGSTDLYWNLADPQEMDAEARFDFVKVPTQLAACILAIVKIRWHQLASTIPHYDEKLKSALDAAAAGKSFGHGYDGVEGFLSTMSRYAKVNMGYFLRLYPDLSPSFTKEFENDIEYLKKSLASGKEKNVWDNSNWSDRAKDILIKIESPDKAG